MFFTSKIDTASSARQLRVAWAVLAALALWLVSTQSVYANAGATVALSHSQVEPGGQAGVMLHYLPADVDVYSLDLRIIYDPNVVSAVNVLPGSLLDGWSVVSNLNTPGLIQIGLATGDKPLDRRGDLLSISILASAEPGQTDLTLQQVDLNEGAIPTTPLHGSVTVTVGALDCQTMPLVPGWNLASTAITPVDGSPMQALQSIDGAYNRVLGDGRVYDPNLPAHFNTLDLIEAVHGYYIRTTSPSAVAWTTCGVRVPASTPIELEAGWNWIGYLPQDPMPVADALASIAGAYQRVLSMDQVYVPALPDHSTLEELAPGLGYLIYMDMAATLIYPAAGQ